MNPFEAADLLAYAAAFDNRQPSVAANTAWAEALADIPLDQDTLSAVATYYSADGQPGERRWLMPHHVRHYRAIARNRRIEDANILYEGDPDETPAEFARNLRQLLRAAGDGQLQPGNQAIPGRQPLELEAGRDSRLQHALAAIGSMPPRIVPGVVNPLAVGCPHCHAHPGRACRTSIRRRRMADPHPARIEAAQQAAAGIEHGEAAS